MEQKQINQLTPEQIKSLMRSAQSRKGLDKVGNGLMERNPQQLYPLSKAQERLWFLTRFSDGLPLYNNPLSIRVNVAEEIDLSILKQAWQDVADRHDILRTTFHLINEKVVQQVHPSCEIPVTYKDLRGLPDEERERVVLSEAKEHGNFLFDITQLPLVRLHVLRTKDNEYVYLINAHHLLNDGWTNSMMAMELPSLYEARKNMVRPALPEVTRQFIDYVRYEQDWMKSADFSAQMSFWKDQFREIPPPLTHLTDYPRTAATSHKGAKLSIWIPAEQKHKILAFCKQNNITPFQYLINAYAILIYRYSGHSDFVIGTPVANRNNIHFQYTFGPFINTLPLPFHFSQGISLNDFTARSGNMIQQALRNQAVPFASLIEELNPPRDLQTNPLFQVHFAYQSFPQLSKEGALSFMHVDVDYEVSKFDLNLWIEDDGDDWLISVTYLSELFNEVSVKRLLSLYERLIGQLMTQPDISIDHLDFIPVNEQSVISTLPLNNEARQRHWLREFDKTCQQFPGHKAVADKNSTLTYHELNTRAEQLASALYAAGIRAGDLAGICLERGADMIVSMLALFKIGAAYLPVEPGTPPDRLRFMVQDSGIHHAISSSGISGQLPENGLNIFLVDELGSTPQAGDFPRSAYDPASLAYVIYTSGTTGNPKGVKIAHSNLINYTEAILEKLRLSPGDGYANVSSIAADLGNTSIFPSLVNGGHCIIVPEECLTDPWLLSEFFRTHPCDFIKIVPSHILALLDSGHATEILPHKLLMVAGETCTVALIKKIRAIAPSLRLINCYGPTETTISAFAYEIPDDAHIESALNSIPIGFPLANTSAYILDAFLQPVAKGSIGEICIGGADVSLGYLNRAVLEQERFIPDPFLKGGVMYRTGDYGRLLPDGSILYHGRKDRQVKIRGFRIELNEVEFTLNKCAGVKQAVVLPPSELHSQTGLTAVLCLKDNAKAETVWEEAARKLRSPMLPDRYIVVDKIPINSNGKVDFAALKKMEPHEAVDSKSLAPRDYLEAELLNIWRQVLQVEELNIEDNFFEAGGHSLLAVKLLSRVNERFGIRLPLSVLFESNNVKQFAATLRSKNINHNPSPVVKFQSGSSGNNIIFLHPAGGNVMCYYPIAKLLKKDWQVTGIQAVGYSMEAGTGIAGLSKHYLDEILKEYKNDGPVVFAGWSMGALIAQNMAVMFREITGSTPGLVIIDQPAPSGSISDEHPSSADRVDKLVLFGNKVSHLVGKDLEIKREMLEPIDEHHRSLLFMDKFRDVGILPDDIQLSEFHGYLGLMIRHNEISTGFQPSVFSGPSLVVKAQERLRLPGTTESAIVNLPDLGWSQWLPDCTVNLVPGNHITVIDKDHADVLYEAIRSWFEVNKQHISSNILP